MISSPRDDRDGDPENSAAAKGPHPLRCGCLAIRAVLVEEEVLESRTEATQPVPTLRVVARQLILQASRDDWELQLLSWKPMNSKTPLGRRAEGGVRDDVFGIHLAPYTNHSLRARGPSLHHTPHEVIVLVAKP